MIQGYMNFLFIDRSMCDEIRSYVEQRMEMVNGLYFRNALQSFEDGPMRLCSKLAST